MTADGIADRLSLYGAGGVEDAALLGALLRGPGLCDERALVAARELLGRYGDVRGLAAVGYDELLRLDGMTEERANRLVAASELGRRASTTPLRRGDAIRASADVYRAYHPRLRDLPKERFYVILVDGRHRVMSESLVSEGTLTSAPVHPREVYREAIRAGAAAVFCLHNHPSGDPNPSADDLEITRRLAEVGEMVGIRLLDHVVVGDGAYVSLADRGLLR